MKRSREDWEQKVMDKLTEKVMKLPNSKNATLKDLGECLAWLAIHETTEKQEEY